MAHGALIPLHLLSGLKVTGRPVQLHTGFCWVTTPGRPEESALDTSRAKALMQTPAEEILDAALPAAAGTVCMILSNVHGIIELTKYRYEEKTPDGKNKFQHPYRPWDASQAVPQEDKHYRAFKATQNQQEWLLMSAPLLWAFSLYGKELPWVGKYTGPLAFGLAVHWSYHNAKYVEAYAEH
eukprot:g62683.t1